MALSPQEFEVLRTKLAEKKGIPTDATFQPSQDGYLSRVGSSLKETGKEVIEGIKTGAEEYQKGVESGNLLQSTKGLLRSGLRTAGGFAEATLTPLTEAVAPMVEPLIKPVIEKSLEVPQVRQAFDVANNLAQKYPEATKDLQNIFDIAALLATAGAAKPVVKAGLRGTGAVVEKVGTGTAGTGRLTSAAGKSIAESAITPTKEEAKKILAYEAKNTLKERVAAAAKGEVLEGKPITRGITALEKGLTGTERAIGVGAKRETGNLWKNTIAPALEKSKATVSKQELFAPIEARIAKTVDPILRESYNDAFNAIKAAYAKSTKWTLKEAQALKEDLAKFIPEKVYQGKPIANELKTLSADMADAIRTKIYSSLDDINIKKSYLDYGNLKKLEELGVKSISEATTKGGFGSFWTGLYDAATTPIKTIGGKVLYRVGDKLEFVGEKGIKTFGEFLKNQGLTIKK